MIRILCAYAPLGTRTSVFTCTLTGLLWASNLAVQRLSHKSKISASLFGAAAEVKVSEGLLWLDGLRLERNLYCSVLDQFLHF